MKLELRHLQIVCAIADHGSVTKAASALGLAQPALTAQLQRIERSLGGPLFHRDRRGARPTVLGEVVLERARIVLPAVQGLEEEVARLAAGDSHVRSYRIGAVNGPILGGLVRRLGNHDPQAHLTTRVAWDPPELARMVSAGRLDYVLIGACGDSPPPPAPGVVWEQVAVDAVWVLLRESDPLAAKDEVDLADLADARWAATPGESCFQDCFVAACARAGFAPRHLYESDVRTCIELAESGDAVALCQSSFRPPPGLVSVPITGTPLRWRHLLGWRPDSPAGRHAKTLVSFAVEAYREAVDRLPRLRAWLGTRPCYGARPAVREPAVWGARHDV
ncbi:MAG TPA: LysR family transcriptional regulator [Natronosporangium sp.]|nr:LysR family transcriptional regulator [Natronosporangium sp.]